MEKLGSFFGIEPATLQQRIKLLVYSGLTISIGFFFWQDYKYMIAMGTHGFNFMSYIKAFAGTLEAVSWMLLIVILEYESYVIEDEGSKVGNFLRIAFRLACYVVIFKSGYVYAVDLYKYRLAEQHPIEIESLCQGEYKNWMYVDIREDEYYPVTEESCDTLGSGNEWFNAGPADSNTQTDSDEAFNEIYDREGMDLAVGLGWSDVVEITSWLIIIILIEINLFIENRKI
ncbi:MAG: hypothetical protein IH948_04430 [Bacteroidetes bacterium]|nr:hypothetical protein [Bacteroidota bacterium]